MTRRPSGRLSPESGLSLIELMIAMVLGLLLLLGVISVVTANSQAYRTNEGLSQVQESARSAFELLGRRLREAGTTGCGNNERIVNTLNDTNLWWQEDWTAVRVFDGAATAPGLAVGTEAGQRIAGTSAILLQGLADTGLSVATHNAPSAQFSINAATTSIVQGDILMVCDFNQASIFQVTNYNSNNVTLVHNTGTGTPGNCTKGLGWPLLCTTNGTPYEYGRNSMIARMATELWYVGANGRPEEGDRSLYRLRLGSGGITVTEEMVSGIDDLQVAFRSGNATTFETAAPADWTTVNAVEITLSVQSRDAAVSVDAGINQGRLQREFTTVVGLRNRLP